MSVLCSSKRIFSAGGWNSSYLLPEPVLGRKKLFCWSLAPFLKFVAFYFTLQCKHLFAGIIGSITQPPKREISTLQRILLIIPCSSNPLERDLSSEFIPWSTRVPLLPCQNVNKPSSSRLQSQDFAEKPISTFFRIKERGTYY